MTVRNDSIDRRLEFLKNDLHRHLPPITSAAFGSGEQQQRTVAGPKKPYLRASMIAPSKKNRQLMRQVSALGMEDPVFGTTEDGPKHPSNIFDDMSLGDVPEDMRDLVSIASDPTANVGGGIDPQAYHQSLGSFPNFKLGLMEDTEASASEDSIGLAAAVAAAATTNAAPRGPMAQVRIEFEGDIPAHPAKTPKQDARQHCEKTHLSYPPEFPEVPEELLEKLNASIQSLPSLTLEDAMSGLPISSSPQSQGRKQAFDEENDSHAVKGTLNQSKTSIRSVTSKTSKMTATSATERAERDENIARMAKRLVCPRGRCGKNVHAMGSQSASSLRYNHRHGGTSNNQAPRAPQRQPTADDDMWQVYSRSVQEASGSRQGGAARGDNNFAPSALHRGDSIYQPIEKDTLQQWEQTAKQRGVTGLNSSLLVAQPENMHIPPTQPGIKGDEPLAKSRAMPNISNLFPVNGAVVSKRTRARRRAAQAAANKPSPSSTDSSDGLLATGRRRSAAADTVSEMTPCTGVDTTSVGAVRSRNTNSVFSMDS